MSFTSEENGEAFPQQNYATNEFQHEAVNVSDFLGSMDVNSNKLHPISAFGGVEYLLLDDQIGSNGNVGQRPVAGALPSRSWGDDLCYGTGTSYLLGLTTGGAWGLYEGLRKPDGNSFKLRVNSVLNSCTRRGPFVGNSLGVIAMMYNAFNSSIGAARGKHDMFNSIGAAAISGAVFKSTAGFRAAGISGGICAALATAWNLGQEAIEKIPDFFKSDPHYS
ncbi:Tim17-domain-containing protein [Basidiobolus meristosporus CBS 931.73]|uniref:Tim17-domain-containing protein n=1 Tax=Basidiobolus meristosporus CBS 931.73 TaxID=1314790 RepID=A0A1Y1Y7Z5_9FUNG|nr:Tim17-domain-containing protein [Basidiobolus meristosporus CBS 931.73]|eukprot:ORX94123.1 Tim17-domain-containing protein [Basidiobolus meristosporus CBS 931.73]